MAIVDRRHEAGGLQVELERQGNRVAVLAWGELDISSAEEFSEKLRGAITESPFGVMVDLGGVTFIDSTGLRALISAATLCHGAGRELIVMRASEQVQCVIETSGVADLLPVAD
jgi:anti-sigma B factor antagonist